MKFLINYCPSRKFQFVKFFSSSTADHHNIISKKFLFCFFDLYKNSNVVYDNWASLSSYDQRDRIVIPEMKVGVSEIVLEVRGGARASARPLVID